MKQKTNYSWWLFRKNKKPSSAKELWNNPKIQTIIKAHNKSFKKESGNVVMIMIPIIILIILIAYGLANTAHSV